MRAPFAENQGGEPDAEEVQPQGSGAQRAIGELLSCSTCVNTWAAAFMVYGLQIAPLPTRAIMLILAAAGVAEAQGGK